jgi:hypothetical protein
MEDEASGDEGGCAFVGRKLISFWVAKAQTTRDSAVTAFIACCVLMIVHETAMLVNFLHWKVR